MLRYEHRSAPLLPRAAFRARMLRHGGYAGVLVGGSMVIGTAGFVYPGHRTVIDALLNAAMLLGGMGPVGDFPTTGGKLFAAVFALYSGLIFIATGAILVAPVAHRLLHVFHLEQERRR
jgi:hypothetical protein